MDSYLWSLLLATVSSVTLALDAQPGPATPHCPPRLEQLIELHRGAAREVRHLPVAPSPSGPVSPQAQDGAACPAAPRGDPAVLRQSEHDPS